MADDAIQQVCINYKSSDILNDECNDGRELGFTGKVARCTGVIESRLIIFQQAIHPAQVDIIQSTFVPTSQGKS